MRIPVIVDLMPEEEAFVSLGLLAAAPNFEIRAVTFSRQAKGLQGLKERVASLGIMAPVADGGDLSPVSLMGKIVDSGEQPVILAWGPLSNVAALLLTRPEAVGQVRRVSFAGGSLRGGDATVAAERNVFGDPEALDIILRFGMKMFMAPLELNAALEALQLPQKGRVLRELCAALVCAQPELFQTQELYVETELSGEFSRGATVADHKGQWERVANVSVLEAFDPGRLSTTLAALFNACGQEVKA